MSEPTGSMSFWDVVAAVAARKYIGSQFPGDFPTETQIDAGSWSGHTADELTEASRWITACKGIVNRAYKRILRAHDWAFLDQAATMTGWATATQTAVGAPSYAAPSSTVTVDAAMFYPSMVGATLTFGTSDTEWTIDGYTSSTVVTVSGDASGEAAGQEITVTADGMQRMPDNFSGEVIGNRIFYPPDGLGEAIQQAPPETIQNLRAACDQARQYSRIFAILAVQDGGLQRWDIDFFPTWSTDTTLHYRHRVDEAKLTSDATASDYPMGGAKFSSALLEAAYMQIELDAGVKGPASEQFERALAEAVRRDAAGRPRMLGYAYDGSEPEQRQRHEITGSVTYS